MPNISRLPESNAKDIDGTQMTKSSQNVEQLYCFPHIPKLQYASKQITWLQDPSLAKNFKSQIHEVYLRLTDTKSNAP